MKLHSEWHWKSRELSEATSSFLTLLGCPASDKAFFKKVYSIPIIQLVLLRYFVCFLLNFSSRKHPEVVISRRSCLFSPPIQSPIQDQPPSLGGPANAWASQAAALRLWAFCSSQKVCNPLKQHVAGMAVYGISVYIFLEVSCFHRYFYPIFCYWDTVAWKYKCSYFKTFLPLLNYGINNFHKNPPKITQYFHYHKVHRAFSN